MYRLTESYSILGIELGKERNKELVAANFEPDHKRLLVKVCQNRGETITTFVHRAVLKELGLLGYLSDEQLKALGMAVS